METLVVDFNMREPDGRVPVLLPPGRAGDLSPGDVVLVTDREGLGCPAVISELSPDGRYAMLIPRGRLRRSGS